VVSKSCCPVCWELLTILGVNSEPIHCGRHLNLYFLKLPKWLPIEVLKVLLERIRALAAVELRTMVWKYRQTSLTTKQHGCTPSRDATSHANIAINVQDDFMLDKSDGLPDPVQPLAQSTDADVWCFPFFDSLRLKFSKWKSLSQ
jgi:hypothetical protein